MHLPQPGAVAQLFKPITWFPPMWVFACGVVASGRMPGRWGLYIAILWTGLGGLGLVYEPFPNSTCLSLDSAPSI
jgi:chlorophyll synthase